MAYLPRRSHDANDPRWIEVRYPATCMKCGAAIPEGARGYYYPKTRAMYCEEHGQAAEADFRTMVEYEEYSGGCR